MTLATLYGDSARHILPGGMARRAIQMACRQSERTTSPDICLIDATYSRLGSAPEISVLRSHF